MQQVLLGSSLSNYNNDNNNNYNNDNNNDYNNDNNDNNNNNNNDYNNDNNNNNNNHIFFLFFLLTPFFNFYFNQVIITISKILQNLNTFKIHF